MPVSLNLLRGGVASSNSESASKATTFHQVSKNSRHIVSAIPASEVIRRLKFQKHPEGGYYIQTHQELAENPSPYADNQLRPLATSILYFLSVDNAFGVFHMNKSSTLHALHQGRAEYTLMYPDTTPPRIEKVILGPNIELGEKLQLYVGSNVWKKSSLLTEDLEFAKDSDDTSIRERVGCLISEVVFPGFVWEDHMYLDKESLERMWGGEEGWEEWVPYTKE
ncbi:RmlC-like cupin domain-containing protein [Irpex rosettiformis]|uniref:RmlC-like cupin domain-containing protein n=1 Tax=Irpex rosettiformis TaxID=378272 RepID=A0ACB8U8J0_9APHY|nr:RmlC-like cupin domain-containing protein [Irpex rosettiformis]